jgi:Hint domain
MSGSTIVIDGVTETVDITSFTANFGEELNFDYGVPNNWSNGLPTDAVDNDILVEGEIGLLPGTATAGVNVVGGGGQQSDTSTGLLIDAATASISIQDYLEIAWLPVINDGEVLVAAGGILQLDGVALESGPYSLITVVATGLTFNSGLVVNYGTLNSGNVITGGLFQNFSFDGSTGLISNNTELEDLNFQGTLDLSHAGYDFVAFSSVVFSDVLVLMDGVGGRFQADGDETVSDVIFAFGSHTGTIEAAGSAEPGSAGDLVLTSSANIDVANTEFYVSNDCTIESRTDIISGNATDVLSFAGQAFASGIIEPGSTIPTNVQAGLFINEDTIALDAPAGSYEIFDIDFLNAAGALLSLYNGTLADHQFTSTFENAGTLQIAQGGNVQAYDREFINDASGVIIISVDQLSPGIDAAGTLALGTLDIQAHGAVFTVTPTTYVNDGLIELVSNVPGGSPPAAAPEFYIGAGTTFGATGQTTLLNNGTILLDIGELNFNDVVVDGGLIVGNGGTITGGGEVTIEAATLSGQVNIPTYTELLNDTFAPSASFASVINVGYDLIIRADAGLADMTINLNNPGSTVIMGLVTNALTIEADATLNAESEVSIIRNWFVPAGGTFAATLDNLGAMNVTGVITDIETSVFLNAGQLNLSNNAELNLFSVSATNQAGGSITIGTGSALDIGNFSSPASLVDAGSMTLGAGASLEGPVTLTSSTPLVIDSGGILLDATIVGGTISGDGGIAEFYNLLNGALYEGALNVEGTVALENGASFAAVGGGTGTINVSSPPFGGAAELAFLSAISLSAGVINLGAATAPASQIAIDAGVTFGSGITVNQTAALAGIDSDPSLGSPGALDNKGTLNANFLDGTFTIAGLSSFTNDGQVNVSNGDTLSISSAFTQNADGTLSVSAGGVLELGGAVSLAAGAVLQFAAGSTLNASGAINGGTLDLNGVDIAGSDLPGSGVFDGVTINDAPDTITGTITFTDVTYNGSLIDAGDLQLGGGDVFQPETPGGATPDIDIVTAPGTLDFIASQELDAVEIDIGGASAGPPELIAGQGTSVPASVTLGSNLMLDETGAPSGGAALVTGSGGSGNTIDNEGQILVDQSVGTFTIQSLSGFTNDGTVTVSNGDNLVLAAPFMQNADGTLQVTGGGTLSVNAAMTIASGGVVLLTPNTTLSLGGATITSSLGGGTLDVTDQVAIIGTGELDGVTLSGDPVIDGNLQLGAGVVTQSDTMDATPTVSIIGTLGAVTDQTLTGVFDIGSPLSAPSAASIGVGIGSEDANVTLAASSIVNQTDASAALTGGSDGNSTLENDGQINVSEPGGTFAITSLAGFINVGDIEVQNGDSLSAAVTVTNNGTIDDQSSVTFQQAVTGTGTIGLENNPTATFLGAVSSGQQIVLNDGLIVIADPLEFSATIENFGLDDALWFPDETVNNPTFTGSQLTFTDGSDNSVAINLQDDVDSPGPMQELPDGAGGFYVGSPFNAGLPCYLAGTRIATPNGEVAVELLSAGDLALTDNGTLRPIVWIGRRMLVCAQHPRPRQVWPVRIQAGAFGRGRPRRDLYLSPDHAVYLQGALIPAKHLVNGSTVRHVPFERVTYYHVELDQHDVLLAEGLPAESYLDTGDRANFHNGGGPVRLHPDFSRRVWEAKGCAPLVVTGPILAAARAQLLRSAAKLAA